MIIVEINGIKFPDGPVAMYELTMRTHDTAPGDAFPVSRCRTHDKASERADDLVRFLESLNLQVERRHEP